MPAHDAETTSSSKTQHRMGKLVNRVRYDRYVASLEQLPETTPPRGMGDPNGDKETRGFANAPQRSQSGPGATVCLRARPVDSSRVITASEFKSEGRRFLGMEEFLATRCPHCGATDANTRRARLCHRSGAQVNQHQPLVHALSRTFKQMSIRHQMESEVPFNADRDLRIGMVIENLRDATASEYRNKAILLDVTYADPGVSQQSDIARRHVCRPTSDGPHACRQR